MHYIFNHAGSSLRNRINMAPGLDFRGDGGYIVVPPSLHISGNQYEWISAKINNDRLMNLPIKWKEFILSVLP